MGAWKALARGAGFTLCVLAFAATALADPGNGNGNGSGNGNGGTPPGQEEKAEPRVAETPASAAAAAPAAAPQAALNQEKQAEKRAEKTERKAVPMPSKSSKAEPAHEKKAEKNEEKAVEQAERKRVGTATAYKGRSAEAHHHVIICHRTGSDSNPYVVINIPLTAWHEAHSPGTGAHPDRNGRHDILLKDPASRPGSKDGFTKSDCASRSSTATPPVPSVTPAALRATTSTPRPQPLSSVAPGTTPAVVTAGVRPKPTTDVRKRPTVKVTGEKATAAPKKEQRSSDVLGAVASAPRAVTRTAATDTLPFTGIPLWIVAVLGGGLLLTGILFRRHS